MRNLILALFAVAFFACGAPAPAPAPVVVPVGAPTVTPDSTHDAGAPAPDERTPASCDVC